MNPAGIIITYIDWSNWKQWWFNIPLFLFQLTFMVVGTAIGKIKWGGRDTILADYAIIATFPILVLLTPPTVLWLRICLFIIAIIFGVAILRNIDWAVVWRAAQASHVRLVLEKVEPSWELHKYRVGTLHGTVWLTANFGYPKMEIQPWPESWKDGKRFEYREPTFTLPPEAIAEMIDYAEGEVGKPYDKLQLLSPAINFVIWIFWWPLWGKEKVRWANQPGGAEFCTSGLTACLRWAIKAIYTMWFFFGYDTAIVMPCLIVISEKWRKG